MTSQMHSSGRDDEGVPIAATGLEPTTFLGRLPGQFMLWTIICGVSAAPSFGLALMEFSQPGEIVAMLAGIAVFIVAYTLVGSSAVAVQLRRRPLLRLSLRIGYAIRVGISLLSIAPPFQVFDLICGAMSMTLAGLDASSTAQPIHVFATTIVQGLVVNVVLGCFIAIIYGLLVLVRGRAADRPPQHGLCYQ